MIDSSQGGAEAGGRVVAGTRSEGGGRECEHGEQKEGKVGHGAPPGLEQALECFCGLDPP